MTPNTGADRNPTAAEAGRSVTGHSIDPDEEAVVIIGSGAGGGTLAYELTAKGIPVVVLEAGPYLMPRRAAWG